MSIGIPQRWNDAMQESGERLRSFWAFHFNERRRKTLFVLSKGFDPRMCLGLQMLLEVSSNVDVDVCLIEFDEGPTSPSRSYLDLVDKNIKQLESLMLGRSIRRVPLVSHSEDGRRVTSQNAFQLFRKFTDLRGYSDVILDISASPRGVFLPVAARILHLVDSLNVASQLSPINFHIVVAEDSVLDGKIHDEGVEERADYIPPFRGGMDREATSGQPRVWIPILGEHQRVQLERIYDLVTPDEICPVLPSPARNPRRGDNLIQDYHTLLFDSWKVEPRNIIYGTEHNPFEVYRQISQAIWSYRESFVPLGGSKFVLSALSSKLLSIGTLLLAYDFKQNNVEIGIAHVDCHGYHIAPEGISASELFGLWITGECD
ncbi:MAG: hypothetical protein ACK4UN_02190 [Limisphaerales bacterium]